VLCSAKRRYYYNFLFIEKKSESSYLIISVTRQKKYKKNDLSDEKGRGNKVSVRKEKKETELNKATV